MPCGAARVRFGAHCPEMLPSLRAGKMFRLDRRDVEGFVRRNPAAKDMETVRESQPEVDRATGA
jgi:hypothetical protein